MSIRVNPDWWQTLFDEVYLITDARSVCDEDLTRREVDIICELLPLKPEEKILDLCGGQGRHSLELCSRGFLNCTVLDYSQTLIDHGRENAARRGAKVKFIRGEARETGLPSEEFDHVLILGNSMGYLPDLKDDLRITKEAFRVLKPGGSLLIDVVDGATIKDGFNPNAWHEIDDDIVVCRQRETDGVSLRAREMVINKKNGLLRDQTYSIRIFEPDTLATLLSEAGFLNVTIHRGFSPRRKKGDYGFMNHRLVATGRK